MISALIPARYMFTALVSIGLAIIYGLKVRVQSLFLNVKISKLDGLYIAFPLSNSTGNPFRYFVSQVNLSVAIVVMVRIIQSRFMEKSFNIYEAILMTPD